MNCLVRASKSRPLAKSGSIRAFQVWASPALRKRLSHWTPSARPCTSQQSTGLARPRRSRGPGPLVGRVLGDPGRERPRHPGIRIGAGHAVSPSAPHPQADRGPPTAANCRQSYHPQVEPGLNRPARRRISASCQAALGVPSKMLASLPGNHSQGAATLNQRPRKVLGWKTPAEALNEHLLSLQDHGVASID